MATPSEGNELSFERDIKPMFRTRDRDSMLQAFDLFEYEDVVEHADAIVGSLRSGQTHAAVPLQVGSNTFVFHSAADGSYTLTLTRAAPSIASVCAIISPEKAEKRAQFVPNWNSIGIPVTTPATKVIAKILPQKCTASL